MVWSQPIIYASRMRALRCVFALGILPGVLGVAGVSASQTVDLPAPYQVAGIERRLPDRDVERRAPYLRDAVVVVDLDDADRAPVPDRERFQRATIVGTAGVAEAVLLDIERRCEFLCGDEIASCRHVAIYTGIDVADVGTPLLALPGSWVLTGYTPVIPDARPQPSPPTGNRSSRAQAAESVNLPELLDPDAELIRPIWSPYPENTTRHRLVPAPSAPAGIALETLAWDERVDSYPAAECTYRVVGGIGSLDCAGFSILLDGGRPLLVSFPDYNRDIADVVASFEYRDTTYRVIRLGLKAQTVFGFLYRTDDAWRASIRPRDFDLLCAP